MANLMETRMSRFIVMLVLCVFLVVLVGPTDARPPPLLSRQRRVSDQRLAEIETLLGLQNVRGKVVTVPVAFGVLDPDKIGRRRRSATNNRFKTLNRLMEIVANNRGMYLGEDDNVLSLPLKGQDIRQDTEDEYGLI